MRWHEHSHKIATWLVKWEINHNISWPIENKSATANSNTISTQCQANLSDKLFTFALVRCSNLDNIAYHIWFVLTQQPQTTSFSWNVPDGKRWLRESFHIFSPLQHIAQPIISNMDGYIYIRTYRIQRLNCHTNSTPKHINRWIFMRT